MTTAQSDPVIVRTSWTIEFTDKPCMVVYNTSIVGNLVRENWGGILSVTRRTGTWSGSHENNTRTIAYHLERSYNIDEIEQIRDSWY